MWCYVCFVFVDLTFGLFGLFEFVVCDCLC